MHTVFTTGDNLTHRGDASSAVLCVFMSDLPPKSLRDLRFHHIWGAKLFPTKGQWNFYVTTTLLLCFQNTVLAHVFVRLTHFSGKHQAASVVDCITVLHFTYECKQTEQWDSPVIGPSLARAFKVCWLS